MWQNHIDRRIGAIVMKKILWSTLVHIQESGGLGVFKLKVHNDLKWRMVAAFYEDENFIKRAIKKQQLEKLVC